MYQVKVSVDEKRTIVSFYEDETLLYRRLVDVPYHITEQDPSVQRKKFKEGRCRVPPDGRVWVEGKMYVVHWFRPIFVRVNKLIQLMPFRNKEIQYFIHTPYSSQVSDPVYKTEEGFKSEEFDPNTPLPTRAVKSITTSFGPYPLSPSKESIWEISEQRAKAKNKIVYIRAHYSNWHILEFLADLLKQDTYIVKIRPSFTMDKHKIEICPSFHYFWVEQEIWASLDIYLQNPKEYKKTWQKKPLKKSTQNKVYIDSFWSCFKR